jgi:hypothetical protein
MDLQAIRYAAMISTLTFERVVEIFSEHLIQMGNLGDARSMLLDHLEWESADDGEFPLVSEWFSWRRISARNSPLPSCG